MKLLSIPLDKIDVGSRIRSADRDLVEAYSTSIQEREARGQRGLIQPIAVEVRDKGRYLLLDGLHRYSAVQALGRAEIAAEVHPAMNPVERSLFEIDAQLLHASLAPIDKAEFLARRKALYEELHPETKHGARGGRGGQEKERIIPSFSEAAAAKLGCSSSAIKKSVFIADHLNARAREIFARTSNAQKFTEVLALAKLDAKLQLNVAQRIADTEAPEKTVSAARAWAEGAAAPTKEQQLHSRMVSTWGRMTAREKGQFLAYLAEAELPKGWAVTKEGRQ